MRDLYRACDIIRISRCTAVKLRQAAVDPRWTRGGPPDWNLLQRAAHADTFSAWAEHELDSV